MTITGPQGRIVPVLLSGGTGSRLWPLSRETYPKQLLSLLGENTLLQQTALRVDDRALFADPLVIANAEHRFAIGEQLRAVGVARPRIVLEPFGRNTAPAVAVAALLANESDPDAVILAMPVDHWVRDHTAFRAAISTGVTAARHGRFVLFGLRPSAPATGFGYIHMGDELEDASPIRSVTGFVEKPDLATVERLLACDGHLWNSGIFLLPVRRFIEELAHRAPDVLAARRWRAQPAILIFSAWRSARLRHARRYRSTMR
jgi:mannose-1-phosphate guanylyltransferase/mannose-6-phosphate isomerase